MRELNNEHQGANFLSTSNKQKTEQVGMRGRGGGREREEKKINIGLPA